MITKSQKDAMRWLTDRNGDGCFTKHGTVLAACEIAPFMRATWNHLSRQGYIEFYNPAGKGYGRLRITDAGKEFINKAR